MTGAGRLFFALLFTGFGIVNGLIATGAVAFKPGPHPPLGMYLALTMISAGFAGYHAAHIGRIELHVAKKEPR